MDESTFFQKASALKTLEQNLGELYLTQKRALLSSLTNPSKTLITQLTDLQFLTPEDLSNLSPEIPKFSKVYKSAVIIMPPMDLCDDIQVIRKKFDKSFVRWMPHVNLLFPFAPNMVFKDVVEGLRDELAVIEPFEIVFREFGYFDHGRKATVWLSPEPKEEIVRLQAVLETVFPSCDDLSQRGDDGFTPHLTVGQFPMSTVGRLIQNYNNDWNEMSFLCDYVHLISRNATDPFEIRYSVPLGGGEIIVGEQLVEKVVDNSQTLFVGNLAFSVKEEDIKTLFAHFGIETTNIAIPQKNNRPAGYAFVTVEGDLSDAIAALDGQALKGRAIKVNFKN